MLRSWRAVVARFRRASALGRRRRSGRASSRSSSALAVTCSPAWSSDRSPARSKHSPGSSCSSPRPSACGATSSARSAAGSAPRSTPARSGCRAGATRWSARTSPPRSRCRSAISLVLAILAKAIAVAFGIENTISVADFVVISVIGGFLSSIVVMGITVGVAHAERAPRLGPRQRVGADRHRRRRHGHAARAVPRDLPRRVRSGSRRSSRCSARSPRSSALVASLRSTAPILRRIARESLPVLVLAGTVDVIAGLTIEKRFESFLVYPALLVLVPSFLEDSGALGGILTARDRDQAPPRHARARSRQPARGRARHHADLPLRDPGVLPARRLRRHRVVGRRPREPGDPRHDRGVDARGRVRRRPSR